MNHFEEHVMPMILSNEVACRTLVDLMMQRGVTISIDPIELSHEECVEVVLKVYSELKRIEQGL